MTMPIVSNEVRDLSPVLFSKKDPKSSKLRTRTNKDFRNLRDFVVSRSFEEMIK